VFDVCITTESLKELAEGIKKFGGMPGNINQEQLK
jgi:hypothetical protein